MPRKPRMYLAGVPVHVIQRGNNRDACFFAEDDYLAYKSWLGDACRRYGVRVYAYVLMTNHVHLLLEPADEYGVSLVMQSLGRRYVQHVNRSYGRTGTLWEGRHKANLVQANEYLLSCYRYIELNPVRAMMVKSPDAYPWSSYRNHALGEEDELLVDHPLYLALGDSKERKQVYRELVDAGLEPDRIGAIRKSSAFSVPLGNERFRKQIEEALGRSIGYSGRGRPRI